MAWFMAWGSKKKIKKDVFIMQFALATVLTYFKNLKIYAEKGIKAVKNNDKIACGALLLGVARDTEKLGEVLNACPLEMFRDEKKRR